MRSRDTMGAAVFSLGVLLGAAPALSSMPDVGDLWNDPADPGWGLAIFEQKGIVFLTVNTYDASGRAIWYVASDLTSFGVNFDPCGSTSYSGKLYETHGTPLGGTPVPTTAREVGTIALSGVTQVSCDPRRRITAQIVVDGRTVTRTLERQTWAERPLAGRFVGALAFGRSCDGLPLEVSGTITITRTGNEVQVVVDNGRVFPTNVACTMRGTVRHGGSLAHVEGNQLCIFGDVIYPRTFVIDGLRVEPNGLIADVLYPGCGTARLAGARRFDP